MIGASDLNRRVTIEAPADSEDGAGGATRAWTKVRTVWAKATPTGGREALAAGTLKASQGWRVEMIYRSDVTTSHRLKLDGFTLNIRSVVDVTGRRESIVLLCESGGRDGA